MPKTENLEETPRKEMHIFYILDTSGSMDGENISTLNRAMEETMEALYTVAKKNADAKLKIAVMEYNTDFRWITKNGPEKIEDFIWTPLEAGGLTSMGAALTELDKKLSRDEFLGSMTGALMPVIIFMTDGYATDDFSKALKRIRLNKWFKRGTKIGFALGDDADSKMISEVVGNSEAVIKTNDLEIFKKLIQFVSVTSSIIKSQSHTSDEEIDGAVIVTQAKNQLDLSDNITPDVGDYNNEYDAESDDEQDDDWSDNWD